MNNRLLLPLLGSVLLLVSAPNGLAQSDDHVNNALSAAEAWVHQIDNGHYDESYQTGSTAMHDKLPQDRWEQVLRTFRTPWGAVVTRREISHVDKPYGYQGAEGEFMVITYETTFQKLDPAVEVITLKWEEGKWRGAGYWAGPKPPPPGEQPPGAPTPQTDTSTITTNKPPQ